MPYTAQEDGIPHMEPTFSASATVLAVNPAEPAQKIQYIRKSLAVGLPVP